MYDVSAQGVDERMINVHYYYYLIIIINPFTAPACKISRAKRCTDAHANSILSTPVTSTFSAVRFDENPFTCQREKEDRNSYGFELLHCYWSLSSDNVEVKGLRPLVTRGLSTSRLPFAVAEAGGGRGRQPGPEQDDRREGPEVHRAAHGRRGVERPGRLLPQQAGHPPRQGGGLGHVHLSGCQQQRLQPPLGLPQRLARLVSVG